MDVGVCPQWRFQVLLSSAHHRLHGLFMFDIKIWALFHAASKLPITYKVSPPWAQSKVWRAHPPRRNEWSHTQFALMLPESSPSQTCFPAPCCGNLLRTHRVISGAPGCLSHFFFFFFFLASITETDISTPQLSSPHTWLYKQSGQSYPLMFINWLCSLDLRVTPLWVKMPL